MQPARLTKEGGKRDPGYLHIRDIREIESFGAKSEILWGLVTGWWPWRVLTMDAVECC